MTNLTKEQKEALAVFFVDTYQWLEEEIPAMQEAWDTYSEADHIGLPYMKEVMDHIARQAGIFEDISKKS